MPAVVEPHECTKRKIYSRATGDSVTPRANSASICRYIVINLLAHFSKRKQLTRHFQFYCGQSKSRGEGGVSKECCRGSVAMSTIGVASSSGCCEASTIPESFRVWKLFSWISNTAGSWTRGDLIEVDNVDRMIMESQVHQMRDKIEICVILRSDGNTRQKCGR
jgi:hypothetical protein